MSAELVVIEKDPVGKQLIAREADWVRMLGSPKEAERFIQEAYAAVAASENLRKCTPESLFGALYFAAQLGLPVGGPLAQFHLTPRNVWNSDTRSKEWQVVPIIGYGGYIRLAMNTGEYDAIEGKLVHANDGFEEPYDDETGTHFRLRPAKGDRGPIVGVIGRALVKGADRAVIEYLDIDTVREVHRPQFWEKTPWASNEADMVKKTGIRRVSKYTSKSREAWRLALAVQADQAVVKVSEQGELEVVHEPVPTEDWPSLVKATDDKADLDVLWKRIQGEGQMTPELHATILAHAGTLTKDSRPKKDLTPEEEAALAYGRDEAAVAAAAREAFEGGEAA